jgi:hypothetical protein
MKSSIFKLIFVHKNYKIFNNTIYYDLVTTAAAV